MEASLKLILHALLPSVLQSCTHNFPLQTILLDTVAFEKTEPKMETRLDKEHGDPVLLPPLVGVLSDPENTLLLQELGERSSPSQNCSLVYFV